MNKLKITFIALFFLGIGLQSSAQDYKFHRVYFYNFTKYIQWPETYSGGDFVIAIAGQSGIRESLDEMAESKAAGNMKFRIIEVNEQQDKLPLMNIIYIPPGDEKHFQYWKDRLKGTSTLLVTEQEGMGYKGSMINFVMDNNRLKFEINKKAAEAAGLKIASELVRFGIEI